MTDKQYRGQDLIDHVEKIAANIVAAKRSNNYRDWFFPMLIDALGLQVGVEIGTDKGEFANHLLNRSKLKGLFCVDPWIDDFGSDYRPGFFDKDGNKRQEEAVATLKQHMLNGRCFLKKGFSADLAAQWHEIEDEHKLDFLYIDGDHSLEGIYTDLYSWTDKVKIGGIIAGHDYKDNPKSGMKDYFGNDLPNMVQTVTNNFCNQYGFKVHSLGLVIKSFWFVKT